jgi:hypothetical protein
MADKVYNGYVYTQQPDGSWKRGQAAQGAAQMPAKPGFRYEEPRAAAEAQNAASQAQVSAAKAPYAHQIAAAEARKATAEATKAEAEASVSGGVGISPDLMHYTGNEFLSHLPKTDAAQVRALAEGRMAFPTGQGRDLALLAAETCRGVAIRPRVRRGELQRPRRHSARLHQRQGREQHSRAEHCHRPPRTPCGPD